MVAERHVDVAVELGFVDGHGELHELLGGCVFSGCPLRARSCYSQIVDAIGRPSHRADCDHDVSGSRTRLPSRMPTSSICGSATASRARSTSSRRAGRHRGQGHLGQRLQLAAVSRRCSTTASRSAISTSATSCRSGEAAKRLAKAAKRAEPARSNPRVSTSLRHRFPGVGTGGRASTGRRARRWSTPPSRR